MFCTHVFFKSFVRHFMFTYVSFTGTKNLKCFIKIVSIAPIVSCKYTKIILTGAEDKIFTEFRKGKTVNKKISIWLKIWENFAFNTVI